MSYYADLEEKHKKANKIGISVRINSEQKTKLDEIREYLSKNYKKVPKGVYYRYHSSKVNDGNIIRFLIEDFEIPENHEK
ncbi:hypothetical protein ES705_41983 [subsurface metagenome]